MKKIVLLFALTFSLLNVFSQREIAVENRSKENAVFGGKANEACVTFTLPQNIHPQFIEQNSLKNPAKIDTIETDVNYHLVFDAKEGQNTREVTIQLKGFSPHTMKWFLTPKQQLNYYLYDPDSTIVDCYNQLTREGLNLFKSGLYEEARKKYDSSKSCSKIPENNDIDARISRIDSILIWKNLGDIAFDISDYPTAMEEFRKIYTHNPEDKYVANRLSEARSRQREICSLTYTTAENYFAQKDFKNAQKAYEEVIAKSCYNAPEAMQRIHDITNLKQLPHVLTYEMSKNTPVGISTGNYKEKSSGYFTIRFNTELFEALRSNTKEDAKPELDISFGWTIKIVKPVWIFFGPGYTGVGEYVVNKTDEDLNLKIRSAVSPEVGFLGKFAINDKIGIALRYTFQYRFALEKEQTSYIGKTRHIFGIGFCF